MIPRRQQTKNSRADHHYGNRGKILPPGRLQPLHPVSKPILHLPDKVHSKSQHKFPRAVDSYTNAVDVCFPKQLTPITVSQSKQADISNLKLYPNEMSRGNVTNNSVDHMDNASLRIRMPSFLVGSGARLSHTPGVSVMDHGKRSIAWSMFEGLRNSKKSQSLAVNEAFNLLSDDQYGGSEHRSSSGDVLDNDGYGFLYYRHFTPFDERCLVTRPLYFTDSMIHRDAVSRRSETLELADLIDVENGESLGKSFAGTIVTQQDKIYSFPMKFNLDDVPLPSLKVTWRLNHYQPAPTLPLAFILLNRIGELLCLVRVSANCACAVFRNFEQAQHVITYYHPVRGKRLLLVDWWYGECGNWDVRSASEASAGQWLHEQLHQVSQKEGKSAGYIFEEREEYAPFDGKPDRTLSKISEVASDSGDQSRTNSSVFKHSGFFKIKRGLQRLSSVYSGLDQ